MSRRSIWFRSVPSALLCLTVSLARTADGPSRGVGKPGRAGRGPASVGFGAADSEAAALPAIGLVHRIFEDRVQFHDGAAELAPGLTLHKVGGHTKGLQVVRVKTRRGFVVLASDDAHLYANMERNRPFSIVVDVGEYLEAFNTMRALASSEAQIVPGHDPLVLRRYPLAKDGVAGIVRLDAEPRTAD